MTDALAAIVEHETAAAAAMLRLWFGGEPLRQGVESEVMRSADGAIAVDPGQRVEQFQPGQRYLISLDAGDASHACHAYLAQFETEADNTAIAHLIVLHRSFDIATASDAQRLRNAVRAIDVHGSVERICVYQHGEQQLPSSFCIRSHYVAALVREIAATPLADDLGAMWAAEPQSLAFYDEYLQWYEDFWKQRPELQPHVRVEPYEDMKKYHDAGGVRMLMLHDEPCGIMAAKRSIEHGLIGWRICEKVIAPRFWGRGLSVAANVMLARSLPSEAHFAMWGTIAPGNQASLRSAQRVGRRIVGSTYWLAMG